MAWLKQSVVLSQWFFKHPKYPSLKYQKSPCRTLHDQNVGVWCAVSGWKIIKPVVFLRHCELGELSEKPDMF
jgi:hypothetical protein